LVESWFDPADIVRSCHSSLGDIVGETALALSWMRSTGKAGASHARVLDKDEPPAIFAAEG
jgi:hypothetical protein